MKVPGSRRRGTALSRRQERSAGVRWARRGAVGGANIRGTSGASRPSSAAESSLYFAIRLIALWYLLQPLFASSLLKSGGPGGSLEGPEMAPKGQDGTVSRHFTDLYWGRGG